MDISFNKIKKFLHRASFSNNFYYGYYLVTPELAKELLSFNTNNRKLKSDNLNKLIKALKNNEYKPEVCKTVMLSDVKVLIDGQHILTAIIKTGISATVMLQINVPHKAFKNIDSGASRKIADVFTIEKISNATNISAATKFLMSIFSNEASKSHKQSLTFDEILNFYYKYEDKIILANKIAKNAYDLGTGKIIKRNYICGLCAYLLIHDVDEAKVRFFFEKLGSGSSLNEHDAILTLRKRIMKSVFEKGASLKKAEYINILFQGWNKYLKNTKWKSVTVSDKQIKINVC